MKTTQAERASIRTDETAAPHALAGLLARWAELAPAEVRMFHREEIEHFGGEIGCITTDEQGRVHHIAGPPDDDDRAMLLWHVLRCARRRGLHLAMRESLTLDGVLLWTFWDRRSEADTNGEDAECPATAAVTAYVKALENAG